MNSEFWDSRYSDPEYVYGTVPNEFLVESVEQLLQSRYESNSTSLKVLCIAEGEGRNAIFLAKKGFQIYAMDYSQQGMKKLQEESVKQSLDHLIHVEVADLNTYDFKKDAPEGWDIIVSVFAHCPPLLQSRVFNEIKTSLKASGHLIYTAYHPTNIGRGTGGPQASELCMTIEQLQSTFGDDFLFHQCAQQERVVNEGKFHQGVAAVVQCFAQKK